MAGIFSDENHSCEIDFTRAKWATDQLHDIFHAAKLSLLSDVDFVAETDDELLLIEYKNANLRGAVNPEAFKPMADKKLNSVARKYYDSQHFLQAIQRGKGKKKHYVYILECVKGDSVLRNSVRVNLAGRLPFKLQKDVAGMEKMIDSLEVLSVAEWNERYGRFPLRLLGDV